MRDPPTGETTPFELEEVLQFRPSNPGNDLYGKSPC